MRGRWWRQLVELSVIPEKMTVGSFDGFFIAQAKSNCPIR